MGDMITLLNGLREHNVKLDPFDDLAKNKDELRLAQCEFFANSCNVVEKLLKQETQNG